MCKNYNHFLLFTLIALALSCSLAWSFDPLGDPDLIAWWTFNEGKGTLAADSSKNGLDATVNGNAQWVPGQYGSALEFDGTDDYVGIQESLFTNLGQFTIACWLAGDPSGASRAGLVGQNDCIEYGFITSNTIQIWTPGGGSLGVPWPYSDLDWHHIVAVGDGSALTVYIDGEQAGTGGSSTSSYGTSTFNVNIGGGGVYDGTGNWFTGMIDDVALFSRGVSAEEVLAILEGVVSPEQASVPNPEDGETDAGRDTTFGWTPGEFANTHNLYLGVTFDDVNVATVADAGGVLVGQGLADATFDPGRFEFGQSYYWRVDEVNSAPDFTVFKGDIWSFTVEPFAYPITPIEVTASKSSNRTSTPNRTIDGSGLNESDQHGTSPTDMWLSKPGVSPAWIQYEFNKVYKLHEMWVWNANQSFERRLGLGAKDVTIETSKDGSSWTRLENAPQFARAPGAEDYAHNTTVDFGGQGARFVTLTIHSGWGTMTQYGLSEVRFYFMPSYAREPQPADGATTDGVDVTLKWRAAREAASHEVLLSRNAAAVQDGSAVVAIVNDTSFTPDPLIYGTTYIWQVNEINEAETPAKYPGDLWIFRTPEFGVVDDMESYQDKEFFEIWATWVDGLGDPANGSIVGTGGVTGSAPETDQVYEGRQSMSFVYNNSTAPVSEATRTFDQTQDWSRSGIQTLVIFFNLGVDNTGGSLYVKINDAKMPYPTMALPTGLWIQWNIDLNSVDVDLTRVKTLTIGMDGAGAKGVIYVDAIRIYKDAP